VPFRLWRFLPFVRRKPVAKITDEQLTSRLGMPAWIEYDEPNAAYKIIFEPHVGGRQVLSGFSTTHLRGMTTKEALDYMEGKVAECLLSKTSKPTALSDDAKRLLANPPPGQPDVTKADLREQRINAHMLTMLDQLRAATSFTFEFSGPHARTVAKHLLASGMPADRAYRMSESERLEWSRGDVGAARLMLDGDRDYCEREVAAARLLLGESPKVYTDKVAVEFGPDKANELFDKALAGGKVFGGIGADIARGQVDEGAFVVRNNDGTVSQAKKDVPKETDKEKSDRLRASTHVGLWRLQYEDATREDLVAVAVLSLWGCDYEDIKKTGIGSCPQRG
jgi:hypothetical protein